MGIQFNADEIFEIAEEIERNGAKFYRKAAAGTADGKIKQMLLDFAEMEVQHEQLFADLRRDLGGEARASVSFDPDGQAEAYLRAMAAGNVFNPKADPSQELTGRESSQDIFQMAINAEKNSIVFYVGLREVVPENLGRDSVQAIIREEMSHITILNKYLETL